MGIWHSLFLLVSYTAFAACLYAAYRTWLTNPVDGLRQFLILVLFVLLFWLLESYGHHRAPFYHYPPVFPHMIEHFDWASVPWVLPPIQKDCICLPVREYNAVPLAVILLEASLTYSAMWTSQLLIDPLLGVRRYVQPFFTGMVMLAVDALVDPVLSKSFDCRLAGCETQPTQPGLGFWEWFVSPEFGLEWLGIPWFRYDIPLFNHAMWYAGPVALVALMKILDWIRDLYNAYVMMVPPPMPSVLELAYLLIVFVAFLIIIILSPDLTKWIPIGVQNGVLVLLLAATVLAVIWCSPGFAKGLAFRWEYAYPLFATLLFTLAALLLGGFTLANFWILALVLSPLLVWFTVSPYL